MPSSLGKTVVQGRPTAVNSPCLIGKSFRGEDLVLDEAQVLNEAGEFNSALLKPDLRVELLKCFHRLLANYADPSAFTLPLKLDDNGFVCSGDYCTGGIERGRYFEYISRPECQGYKLKMLIVM